MATFILLSKIPRQDSIEVRALAMMEREFDQRVESECPDVQRIASYALLGEYDFLHIFDAPDVRTATKVALLANIFGNCATQTLTAIPFDEFCTLLEEI